MTKCVNCKRQFDNAHRRFKTKLRKGELDQKLLDTTDKHDEHLATLLPNWQRKAYYYKLKPVVDRLILQA